MPSLSRSPLLVVAVAFLTACVGPLSPHPEEMSCAAVLSFGEPVLTITKVTGPDGQDLGSVRLTALTQDGRPALRALRDLVRDDALSHRTWTPGTTTSNAAVHAGLVVDDAGRLLCQVPCAFGTSPAVVAVTVATPGGDRVSARVRTSYASSEPRCGGRLDDGTDLVLTFPVRTG